MNFSSEDLKHLSELGISKEKVITQVEKFRSGFPYIKLDRPATPGDGIVELKPAQFDLLIKLFEEAANAGRLMKFVPASGAASRMFHALSHVFYQYDKHEAELRNGYSDNPEVMACLQFLEHLRQFPFYDDIDGIEELIQEKSYDKILGRVIDEPGLQYAYLPKALIKFHRYPDHSRTALEEHWVEALEYTKDQNFTARIHFTISPEHQNLFNEFLSPVLARYENGRNKLIISFSEQKKSTDTVAISEAGEPLRDTSRRLVFRPAGHGALLENLNDLNGDVIFIKNIDNVVPDRLKDKTFLYKKLLAGYLLQLQKHTFYILRRISKNDLTEQALNEAIQFAEDQLHIVFPEKFSQQPESERIKILFDKLDRPIRVCGMVKNQGEPGGGPFWVNENDGTLSLQIVEKNQIDTSSAQQKGILESSTHFNPVDLVCGVRDYKGVNFDLRRFTDPNTGFISVKSKDGKPIKTMELPGLWNGSMAQWITVFVEVPLITFNPVKTVNDLLRPEHQ